MPLDINGILSNDTSSVSTNSTSIQPMTNLYADQPKFNLDIFFKVINYMLFLISVILNIVLYRKLKATANSEFKNLAAQWLNDFGFSNKMYCSLTVFVLRNR